MARWTVSRGDAIVEIEVTDDKITIDVPSGVPFTADIATVEEIRSKLGAAIGVAQQPRNPS